MHSPADSTGRLRLWLERAAHLAGIALIAWLLVDSLRTPPRGAEVLGPETLAAELRRWSTIAPAERVHLRVDGQVAPAHREWLAALASAGTEVSWEDDVVSPLAVALDPVPDPDGGSRVRVAARPGTMVVLEDELGVLDSVTAGGVGVRFLTRTPLAGVRVRGGGLTGEGLLRDSLSFGRILLAGRVGWESNMVAAALEERGWEVDVRLALSPKGDILQGATPPRLDPSRYSAVVLLDTTSLIEPAQLLSYVREGGGLVMTARAGESPTLARLRPGRPGRVVEGVEPFDTTSAEPRRALALTSVITTADAVPLEFRDDLVATAARRVGRGRVVMTGYTDTWRWRLAGGNDALEAHRDWWADLVAAVAHVEQHPLPLPRPADEAPLANLVELLGDPAPAPPLAPPTAEPPYGWILAALAALLLTPWLSRRLRGAP